MRPPPACPDWGFFLDLDGTLVDIADSPQAIRVDAALVALLTGLAAAAGGAVAVVSGRALADLDTRFPGVPLAYAGQHGLERRDARGQEHRYPVPGAKATLAATLAPVLERHPGLLLEDKGLSLALHYRQAPRLAAYVHRLAAELVADAAEELVVQKGKRVVEIRPAGADKGAAVDAFLAEMPFAGRRPVYVGDDLTDEHGFAAVNRRDGISVKVGNGPSEARYRLADVAAVRSWLAEALEETR